MPEGQIFRMLRRVDWSIVTDVSEKRKNTAVDHTRSSTLQKGKSLAKLEIIPRDFHVARCHSNRDKWPRLYIMT